MFSYCLLVPKRSEKYCYKNDHGTMNFTISEEVFVSAWLHYALPSPARYPLAELTIFKDECNS